MSETTPRPADVTRDRFLVWRAPRFGAFNGQNLTNPVWQWLARTKLNAYQANKAFDGPSSLEVGPCWTAERFGQSRTRSGRIWVEIGGEHEDHYDSDFCIYNDVIVRGPKGALAILGYPTHVFPSTDFHSASLVNGRIVTIGCLGYPGDRKPDVTPVFSLELTTWKFSRLEPKGPVPGWLWNHSASVKGATITVRGGERLDTQDRIVKNVDDWRLDLNALRWTRLTRRRWQQWSLAPVDSKRTKLFDLSMLQYHLPPKSEYDRQHLAEFTSKHGALPDSALYASRYAPPVAFKPLPKREEHWREHRIRVGAVTVCFVESDSAVEVTFEGTLSPTVTRRILAHAQQVLAQLHDRPWTVERRQ